MRMRLVSHKYFLIPEEHSVEIIAGGSRWVCREGKGHETELILILGLTAPEDDSVPTGRL